MSQSIFWDAFPSFSLREPALSYSSSSLFPRPRFQVVQVEGSQLLPESVLSTHRREGAWPVDGPTTMDLQGMCRSFSMHKKWEDTYAKCVRQEADLYASTASMGVCHSMEEALAKFRAKREFMECAYTQLIAMDANNFATYDEENSALIKLALGVK